jgi:hypothetical protein
MNVALYIAALFCTVCAAWALALILLIFTDRRRPVRDDDGRWRAP